MLSDLEKLEKILKIHPVPDEFTLEQISVSDASLIWSFASKYLEISKDCQTMWDKLALKWDLK